MTCPMKGQFWTKDPQFVLYAGHLDANLRFFFKLAAISFLVTSHVIYFVAWIHIHFAFATYRYRLSGIAQSHQ